jgi:hypothetical protein
MSIGSRMPGRRSGTRLDWLFLDSFEVPILQLSALHSVP